MKQKTKLLIKALLLCLVLFFASCEKEPDFSETDKSNKSKVQIEKFSMPDGNSKLDLNPLLLLKINEIKTKNLLAQTLPLSNTQFKFSFDEFDGLVFKIGTYQSYTFPVTRQNGDGKIENVVFSLNVNGKYDVYLVKYDFTQLQLNNFTLDQIKNKNVVFTDISLKAGAPTLICVDTYSWGSGDTMGGSSTQPSYGWVLSGSDCTWIGGGNSYGGGLGDVITGPYSGGYSGGGHSSLTQTQEDKVQLNTWTNGSVVKPKMQDLSGRFTENVENGYEFKYINVNRLEASNLIVGTEVDGVQFPPIEPNSLIRIHTHPNSVEPTPTIKDVVNFILLYLAKKDAGVSNADDATVIIMNKLGNYAFRVQDGNKMEQFYDDYLHLGANSANPTKKTYKAHINNLFVDATQKANRNCSDCSDDEYDALLELYFLDVFQRLNCGVSIYHSVPVTPTNPNYIWSPLR